MVAADSETDLEPAFRRALDAHGDALGLALPDLKRDVSMLEKLQDQLRKLIEDFFSGLIPSSSSRSSKEIVAMLIDGVLILAAVGAVALIAWIAWKLWPRRRGAALADGRESGPAFVEPAQQLLADIEQALAGGRVDEAARLRWKLFLLRDRQRAWFTPQEYAAQKMNSRSGIDWAALLPKQYELMFAGPRASLPSYRWVDETLRKLENTEGSAT